MHTSLNKFKPRITLTSPSSDKTRPHDLFLSGSTLHSMGCSPSRIDQLPAVSLCHDRCKFLEEALYQSYALADAHVAYMHSLKSLGPSLRRFFDQTLINNQSDYQSNGHYEAVSKPTSPDNYCPSSSTNSEISHIDFRSDSEDEEFRENKDFDSLRRIPQTQFSSYSYDHHDYNKYDYPAWKTPPPPAPSSSAWDFLNFFETYERYDLPVKDKEFVKEIRGEDKCSKNGEEDRRGEKLKAEKGNNVKQNEVKVVEKKVKSEKEASKDLGQQEKIRSVLEVMKEVEVLFDRAADSGNEVLKILDAGKFRYYYKTSVYQGVSSKMLHPVNPSFLEKNGSVHGGFDEDLCRITVNLSSALRKLCLWEKKLYDEVKAEEKLRIVLAKNCRQMNNLGEKDADAKKVNSTQTLLRMLSTKTKVAIQVIDKISVTINKLRDEELWPLINDLIEKLLGMWKVMVECHRCQSQAVIEARSLDAIASNVKFSDAYFEAAIQLKIELQNWNLSFSNWINAQRGCVKALNGWLLRCLPSEPEEMPDDVPSFSPGRIGGAPPVFAFCNQWFHAIDRVSEMEVIYAMNGFFASINHLVERHNAYLQQKLTTDKDMEKKMKILEREGRRLQKVMQARGKMFQGSRAVHRSEMISNNSLQLALKQIFVAVEQFSADSMHGYEELHVHIEHSRLSEENPAS